MTQYPLSCELRIGMTYQVDIRQTDSVNRVTVLKQDFTQYVITGNTMVYCPLRTANIRVLVVFTQLQLLGIKLSKFLLVFSV